MTTARRPAAVTPSPAPAGRPTIRPHWATLFAELAPLLTRWPPVLPREPHPELEARPLALGTREKLAELLRDPADPKARRLLARALAVYCRSTFYLTALATDGSRRHDLDGRPIAPVEPADRAAAASLLLIKAMRPSPRAGTGARR